MPRAVLHQVSLTFTVRCKVGLTRTVRHTQVRCTLLLQASGGQEQYYVRFSLTCQFDIYSQTYPGQMYPLIEASDGQEQYYIRSAWHLQSDVRSAWHVQSDIPRSDVPPLQASGGQESYDIRSAWYLQSDIPRSDVPPPIQAYGGQEQYYVRSAWHLVILWIMLSLSQMCYSVYISSWIDWDIYVEWSFCCVYCCSCCCCCYCIMLLLQQENYTLKRTTRTKRSTYMHFLFNYQ